MTFVPLYRQRGQLNRLGSSLRSQLENATALGSRIPPHAVLLHVNNTPVKLHSLFKKDVHLRNDARTIIYIYIYLYIYIDSAGIEQTR